MKTKNLKQVVEFKAKPKEIYELLMDSKRHSAFTGSKAIIGSKVGDKIIIYDGYIGGENVELIKDKEIVQKWRGDNWPKGHYSIV